MTEKDNPSNFQPRSCLRYDHKALFRFNKCPLTILSVSKSFSSVVVYIRKKKRWTMAHNVAIVQTHIATFGKEWSGQKKKEKARLKCQNVECVSAQMSNQNGINRAKEIIFFLCTWNSIAQVRHKVTTRKNVKGKDVDDNRRKKIYRNGRIRNIGNVPT